MIAGDDDDEEGAAQYSSEEEEGATEIPLGPPFLTNIRYTVKSLNSKTQ